MDKFISVIIPTFNRKDLVSIAIESALRQTLPIDQYEIIVVDDGSSDGTEKALKENFGDRICYYWQENQGESVARNFGVSVAKGEYLAFLDSDDVWLPEKLEIQLEAFSKSPNSALVYTAVWLIDENGKRIQKKPVGINKDPDDLSLERFLFRSVVYGISSNIMVRKRILAEIGFFDDSIQYGEDWDLLLRLRTHGVFTFIEEPLWCCRVHVNNQNNAIGIEKIQKILDDHIHILDKLFAKTDMNYSEDLSQRIYGIQFERAGYSCLSIENWEHARDYLTKAATLDPFLFHEPRITNMTSTAFITLVMTKGLFAFDIAKELKGFMAYWESEIEIKPPYFERLLATCYQKMANYWYQKQEYQKYRNNLMKGFIVYPKEVISKRNLIQFVDSLIPFHPNI